MKKLSVLFLAALILFTVTQWNAESRAEVVVGSDSSTRPKVIFEPHGEALCASGCALSRHPTPTLEREHFAKLMEAYADQPMSGESEALEELLYFGPQTESFIEADGPQGLDEERFRFLKRELTKTDVTIEFRIIDEHDVARVSLPPTTVPFDNRYVFEPLLTKNFQPPEASGTVKRVGLNHIWQRI